MKAKITASTLESFKPQVKPYEVVDNDLPGFILRIQPSGRKIYYFSYREKGGSRKRIKIGRVGELKPNEARRRAKTLAGDVAGGTDVQHRKQMVKREKQLQSRKVLLWFIEKEYTDWLDDHRKRGSETIRRLKRQFGFLLNRPMDAINPIDVERWRRQRLSQGISKATINRDIMALRGCLSKAAEWNLIPYNPIAGVKSYSVDRLTRVRYLDYEEEVALRQALDSREEELRQGRDRHNHHLAQRGYELFPDLRRGTFADFLKPMVILTLNTGLRKGEVFSLEWRDINFMLKQLTIRAEKSKSNKTRYVPLNDEALMALSEWSEQVGKEGWVFPGREGKPLRDIKKSWYHVLAKAKIKDFRWHDLRHHFASRLVMLGEDLNTIRELLGHADLSVTIRYAHLSPDHKAHAVDKLRPPRLTSNVTQMRL
jgi:integrase